MRKKELELILEKLKPLEKPKISLEQYTIPADLAAEILNIAFLSGDIENKKVADFGCGSGRLAIGAALLGAKEVVGIDIDEDAVKQAKENLRIAEGLVGRKLKVKFFCHDITKWRGKYDTVIQNPPFGIKGIYNDRIFLEKALNSAKRIYSLHRNGRKETRNFIIKFVSDRGGKIENVIKFKFLLPHLFKFHRKPKLRFDIDLYIIGH
ncbi:MAG: METTL5 family protein [Candidatus Aenigmatarchaeota archaeon]